MISLLHVSLLAMLQLTDTRRVFPPMQGQNLEGRTLEMPVLAVAPMKAH